MDSAVFDTNKKYEEMGKELESARVAMQVLTDNDNAHMAAITTMGATVQQLSLTKLNNAPNRSFIPTRANGN